MRKKPVQARLLYPPDPTIMGLADPITMAAPLAAAGFAVESASGSPGTTMTLLTEDLRLTIGLETRPQPLARFRGATRPPESEADRRKILRLLAHHAASVSVKVNQRSVVRPVPDHTKVRAVQCLVMRLMELQVPELVLCPGRDWILTAEEAAGWLSSEPFRLAKTADHGRRPLRLGCTILMKEPVLSRAAVEWLGIPANGPQTFDENSLSAALNRAIGQQGARRCSASARVAAKGRAALYLVSLAALLVVLPLGAQAL